MIPAERLCAEAGVNLVQQDHGGRRFLAECNGLYRYVNIGTAPKDEILATLRTLTEPGDDHARNDA